MHSDNFWSGHTPQPSLSKAHIHLPSLKYHDRHGYRKYLLRNIHVVDCRDWDGTLSSPRWCVIIDACDNQLDAAIQFKTFVLWSAVYRNALAEYDSDRGLALGKMARERIDDYLRHHPFPDLCCYPDHPIILEYA
jgi:hypothetical protein